MNNNTTATTTATETYNKDVLYDVFHGIVGLSTIIVNGTFLLAYVRRPAIQKHISFMMLQTYIFCFIHGFIEAIVQPLRNYYLYQESQATCIIATLTKDYVDDYYLVLLPLLTIERLVHLRRPFIRRKKARCISIWATIIALIGTAVYAWVPLLNEVGIRRSTAALYAVDKTKQYTRAITCQGALNKNNWLAPIFTISLEVLSVFIIVIVYLWMYFIARTQMDKFPRMTDTRRRRLKKAAISVGLVVALFIVTDLPYGIALEIRSFCEVNSQLHEMPICSDFGLELQHAFSIVAHLGNVFAPLLFSVISTGVRKHLAEFLGCPRLKAAVGAVQNGEASVYRSSQSDFQSQPPTSVPEEPSDKNNNS